MADLVGSIVAQANPGIGGATTPGTGSGPAPKTGGDHKDAESRINALVAQRNEAQRRFQAAEQRVVDLESRFAALEGRVSQQPSQQADQGIPTSWEQLNETQLQKAYADAVESQNAHGQFAIQKELQRRAAESMAKSNQQSTQDLLQHQRNLQEVASRIQSEFGARAKPGDPLYERADAYASMLSQKYGKDVLQKQPDLIFLAFAAAERDISIPERQELQDLRAQVERFKAQQSIEPGAVRGVRHNAEVSEALKRGDVNAAVSSLNIVKRMAERR